MKNKQQEQLPKTILATAWAIALGAIAPMLDATMVNIAIDQLTKDFQTNLNMVQWSVTGYTLALAVTVSISGWLMNRLNGKKVFILATLIFGVTSVLAGVSWSVESFIFFRLLQGAAAGVITPLMFTLLVKVAGKERVGRVMAIVSMPMIFGPIFAPVLAGFIVQVLSWRWIFFLNVFVTLFATPLMKKNIPDFAPFNRKSRLDFFGIFCLSIMSVGLIYGLTKAADTASLLNQSTVIFCGIGCSFLAIYVFYNSLRKNKTVLPLKLFTYQGFASASIGLFLANIAIMGPMLILPLFFQRSFHFNAIMSAFALIPQGVGMLATRRMIGRKIDQFGSKRVVQISLPLALVSVFPLLFVTEKTSMVVLVIVLFIRGASVGGLTLPLMSEAYIGLNDELLADAGVGINIIENLGACFGTALLATIVATFPKDDIQGFHAGFLFSAIALVLMIPTSFFLTGKQGYTKNA
ncbi:drug resistance transporter, EmrB/QacA subfamily [Pilibacter termitis]|uniref:Drug resistance transporter, EmrB/QacA subfamily n=1 Tax=Pilibacter termitis TaxID=263852 RepID=A0A1T4P4Y6_9ENTE|nr:DHA2 family efflux MFS transporter permease subunit [Pilibacter termitis]SJZ86660.1 drug resistance transporter, EmrB/QacA subfamily [Pilibacter termitis]